jgi:thioredoxin reductase
VFQIDVVIVGGGPAGLNAALTLGRARRRVLLVDSGQPRNAPAQAVHGFLTRDGLPPAELRRIGREQLAPYPSVEVRNSEILDVQAIGAPAGSGGGFAVTLADRSVTRARRLLLATGLVDQLPAIDGLAELWGTSVLHCPYCHGWEVRDQALAVLGSDQRAIQLAAHLTRFSPDVVLCTNGAAPLDAACLQLLAGLGVAVREEPIQRLDGDGGRLRRIVFAAGPPLARQAAFVRAPYRQRSPLPARLGCALLEDGTVQVDDLGRTSVPGVYAAGDLARRPSLPFATAQVVMAAAAGATAAVAIDQHLLVDDLQLQARRQRTAA